MRKREGLQRVSRMTTKQIAKGTGLSEEEVKRCVQELLKDHFIRSCYDDSGKVIPDLYEIPEFYDKERGKIISGLVRENSAIEKALRKRRISLRTIILFPILMVGVLACFILFVFIIVGILAG